MRRKQGPGRRPSALCWGGRVRNHHITGEPDKSSPKATDARCLALIRIRGPLLKIPFKKASAKRKMDLLVQSNGK